MPEAVLDRVCSTEAADGSDDDAQDALLLWAMVLAESLDQRLDDLPEEEILEWVKLVRAQLIGERLRRRGLVVSHSKTPLGFSGPKEGFPFVFPVN